MEVINLSSRSFKGLRTLELPNTVYNTEGKIYIYEDKDKWDKRIHLVKRLYINSGPIFSNKLATVNSLVDYEGQIGIPEFVYPEKLLTVNGEIVGFTMPYVPSTNLKEILTSSKTPAEVKIKYLKDIGTILEKMDEVRKYADLEDFYLNDLHEGNFIVDREGTLRVIDLDSLRRIGVSTELIDIISDIYSNKSNTNPKELLDGLEPVFYKCHESVFKSLTKQRRCQ